MQHGDSWDGAPSDASYGTPRTSRSRGWKVQGVPVGQLEHDPPPAAPAAMLHVVQGVDWGLPSCARCSTSSRRCPTR